MQLSKLTILATLLVVTLVSSNLNWGKEKWKGIIEADAKGYYAYLPAVFIYEDLNFGFFDFIEKEKYYNENYFYDYREGAEGHVINRYYAGTALACLPFFLTAHYLSYLQGFEMDGYSKLYPIFIHVAALFYLLIGLLFLNATLRIYGIGEKHRSLTIIAAVFGTNLFYYTIGEPGMSHVFSFGFISMFLYFSRQYFVHFHKKHFFYLALLLGIITLIRPVNGIVIFALPFAAGGMEAFRKGILSIVRQPLAILISFLGFAAIVSVQLVIYKISTGSFFIYGYGEAGFNFADPHMIDILFSYKKGLFLYTPMYLLALAGSYYLWKRSRFELYTLLGFLILITYVFSSWFSWYYGGSFSSRVYVEFIPLFMVPMALALDGIKKKGVRIAYVSLIALFIVLCQVQTYQYRYFDIHWEDMTKEKYWDVFLMKNRWGK